MENNFTKKILELFNLPINDSYCNEVVDFLNNNAKELAEIRDDEKKSTFLHSLFTYDIENKITTTIVDRYGVMAKYAACTTTLPCGRMNFIFKNFIFCLHQNLEKVPLFLKYMRSISNISDINGKTVGDLLNEYDKEDEIIINGEHYIIFSMLDTIYSTIKKTTGKKTALKTSKKIHQTELQLQKEEEPKIFIPAPPAFVDIKVPAKNNKLTKLVEKILNNPKFFSEENLIKDCTNKKEIANVVVKVIKKLYKPNVPLTIKGGADVDSYISDMIDMVLELSNYSEKPAISADTGTGTGTGTSVSTSDAASNTDNKKSVSFGENQTKIIPNNDDNKNDDDEPHEIHEDREVETFVTTDKTCEQIQDKTGKNLDPVAYKKGTKTVCIYENGEAK